MRVPSGKSVDVVAVPEESGPEEAKAEEVEADGPADQVGGPAEEEGSPLVTAGWVTFGAGAALLIGGAVTGGMVLSIDGDLKDRCEDGVCLESERGDVDKMDSLALATDILIGVGTAAAATGIVLLIVGNKKEKAEEPEVSVVPLIGPGVSGIGLEGRF